jgi:Uncharacterized alpha/beta hydrolase domain (DUF2235)
VEGIATEDLKKDNSFLGLGLGQGDTGVEAKVTMGCMYAGNMMAEKGYSGKNIDYLFVNVYGFSRGAAAARHFIHVASKMAGYSSPQKVDDKTSKYYIHSGYKFSEFKLTKIYNFYLTIENTAFIDKYGYFGACLLKNKIQPKFIVFNFVGLYDSVASFGIRHKNNTSDLKLDSITKAKFIYHLASDDEYRENFPLTNINSCGINGVEFILPGVHSDIGGSYLDNILEVSAIDSVKTSSGKESKKAAQRKRDQRFDDFKKIVESEGWFKDFQLQKEFYNKEDFDDTVKIKDEDKDHYGLVGKRTLSNAYDKIPLHLMVHQSKNFKVIYNENKLKTLSIKDKFIQNIQNDIHKYVNACIDKRNEYVDTIKKGKGSQESVATTYVSAVKQLHYKDFMEVANLKRLRNEYLHWSAKSDIFGIGPSIEGPAVQEKRKRYNYNG